MLGWVPCVRRTLLQVSTVLLWLLQEVSRRDIILDLLGANGPKENEL